MLNKQEKEIAKEELAQRYFKCSYFMYRNAGDKTIQDYLVETLGEKLYWDCCNLGKIVSSTLKTFENPYLFIQWDNEVENFDLDFVTKTFKDRNNNV